MAGAPGGGRSRAMNCRRVQDLLSDYHDGLLPPRDGAAVAAHLRACPACARLRAALATIEARARATGGGQTAPPPDLGRRAVDRWATERDARITGGGPLWVGASRLAFGVWGLALLALLGMGLARWGPALERSHAIRIARLSPAPTPCPPPPILGEGELRREAGGSPLVLPGAGDRRQGSRRKVVSSVPPLPAFGGGGQGVG